MGEYNKETITQWVRTLGADAMEDEEFLDTLAKAIWEDAEAAEEFACYMETGNFLCRKNVDGYTVVDVMVWQIDHFKAEMDRGKYAMSENGSKMVLRAFDTFMKMKKQPDKYKGLMQSETGTDYPDKY